MGYDRHILALLLAALASAAAAVPAVSPAGEPAKTTVASVGTAANPTCPFKAGALPRDTLPKGSPLGARIPIDHFVVVMQENRSFDHYFQQLPDYGQPAAAVRPVDTTAGPGDCSARLPLSSLCVADVPHNVDAVHRQFEDGRLDGFLAAAGGHRARAVGYYGVKDLPFYYAIARTFALGDRYFSGLLGPTWPNRMMALSGTSFGHVDNEPPPPADEQRSLIHQLEEAGDGTLPDNDRKSAAHSWPTVLAGASPHRTGGSPQRGPFHDLDRRSDCGACGC